MAATVSATERVLTNLLCTQTKTDSGPFLNSLMAYSGSWVTEYLFKAASASKPAGDRRFRRAFARTVVST